MEAQPLCMTSGRRLQLELRTSCVSASYLETGGCDNSSQTSEHFGPSILWRRIACFRTDGHLQLHLIISAGHRRRLLPAGCRWVSTCKALSWCWEIRNNSQLNSSLKDKIWQEGLNRTLSVFPASVLYDSCGLDQGRHKDWKTRGA